MFFHYHILRESLTAVGHVFRIALSPRGLQPHDFLILISGIKNFLGELACLMVFCLKNL
jgi:hypothetical protein